MSDPNTPARSAPVVVGTRAVVLAGGKGTRLRPFTVNFPKPLVPIGDRPVLEHLLRHLVRSGVTDITLALGHLAELIKAYFAQRKIFDGQLTLRYVEELEPTGTAGALALVEGLDQTFLVLNGDLLTNVSFADLLEFHRANGATLTIATHARKIKADYGILQFDKNFNVTEYLEKPESTHYVSMGVYAYEPRVLRYVKPAAYLDFPDLVSLLIKNGEKVSSYVTDCEWLDIGRPEDYALAQELMERNGASYSGD